jgi:hypothetical protein
MVRIAEGNSRYFVIFLYRDAFYLTTYRASQDLCGVGNSGGASRSSFDSLDRHSGQTIRECCSSVALVEPVGRNPYLARTT